MFGDDPYFLISAAIYLLTHTNHVNWPSKTSVRRKKIEDDCKKHSVIIVAKELEVDPAKLVVALLEKGINVL
jgi:hypothetical protein